MHINRFTASMFVMALVACLTCSAQQGSTKGYVDPQSVRG